MLGRVNVIGLMNRQSTGYFHPVETILTSTTVAEAMAGVIQSRPAENDRGDDGQCAASPKGRARRSGGLAAGACVGVVLATLFARAELH